MRTIVISLIITIFNFNGLSQTVISTSSNRIHNGNGEIDYTIGQLVYESFQTSSHSFSQGIHNPIKVNNIGGTYVISDLDLTVFPNPTRSQISIQGSNPTIYIYNVLDMNGQMIFDGIFLNQIDLNLESLASGLYILKVNSPEKRQQSSYQIIKQ
jgi:hypothetical protein